MYSCVYMCVHVYMYCMCGLSAKKNGLLSSIGALVHVCVFCLWTAGLICLSSFTCCVIHQIYSCSCCVSLAIKMFQLCKEPFQ